MNTKLLAIMAVSMLNASGVGLLVSRFTPDPKFFVPIGIVAAAAYYIFLVF